MRLKIGDTWYTAEAGQPISLELDVGDCTLLSKIINDPQSVDEESGNIYLGYFHNDDPTTVEEKKAWLKS